MGIIEEKNRFLIEDKENSLMGEITFIEEDRNIIIIDHTFVNPIYRGQGIGEKLVKLVVDKALKEGKKIIPLCSYAAKEFEKKKEYLAVLYLD